jgi:hypothetical protein
MAEVKPQCCSNTKHVSYSDLLQAKSTREITYR